MRTASVLASALVAACVGCTYDIPDLEAPDGSASGDDGALIGPDAGGGGADVETGTFDAGHLPDATAEAGACTKTLCPCDNASECASGICAQSLMVGSALFTAAGHQFCTEPCCTSANCHDGTVCFGSGQGGNYCVDPKWLGRSAPGQGQGGASCSQGSDCLSGLCTGSTCADTCCSFPGTGECASGSQCAFGNFPGAVSLDQHFTGRCGAPGGAGSYGAPCSGNSQCAGGLCFDVGTGGNCTRPCGSSPECGGGNACQLDYQGSDLIVACFPWNVTADEGATCSTDDQCRGAWCGSKNQCSNVCFTDGACSIVGWHCLPQQDTIPGLGNYLVLACE